jgi:mRNA interferase MazF
MNGKAPYCPDQFDMIEISAGGDARKSIGDRHLVYVLSPQDYNVSARLCVVCPVTPTPTGYAFEVNIARGGKTKGAVLADQLNTFDWSERGAMFVEHRPDLARDTLAKLRALLSL